VSTFPAATLIELHKQLREATNALVRIADEIGVYIPSVAPDAPPSELVILVSDHDRMHFAAGLSRCIGAADAVRKAFEPDGGGRAA